MRRSACIAFTAIMAALAFLISLARIEVPFYPLIYLKFDFAEIPSTLTFLLLGPSWSYICATIHYFGLLARSGDPLGPTMKYLAVISMLAGMSLYRSKTLVSFVLGALARIAVMSIANIIVVGFLFPSWLSFIKFLLESVGLSLTQDWEVLLVAVLLTAVYNAIHTILSVVPSWIIDREVKKRVQV